MRLPKHFFVQVKISHREFVIFLSPLQSLSSIQDTVEILP